MPREAALPKLKFAPDEGFHEDVKRRVAAYFLRTALDPRDDPRMYAKTAAILVWFGASYALLVFAATTWWQGALLALSLALAFSGIGFSVMHDANHGAYSKSGAVNATLGFALDFLGGSPYIWRWKHNVLHHSYPNVSGADDDLDVGPLARLAPEQPRHAAHRFQAYYLWLLYGLLVPKWHFADDAVTLATARMAGMPFPRPRAGRFVVLLLGKVLFLGWALVLPALFHPPWVVFAGYAAVAFVAGLVMSVVFQLAHCVEEASFPSPLPGTRRLAAGWAAHQVETTIDFARGSRLLTWYLGGLNFQVEHHLFPTVCHVHYPQLAPLVEAACADHGVRYRAQPSLWAALRSHGRWLRRMGRVEG